MLSHGLGEGRGYDLDGTESEPEMVTGNVKEVTCNWITGNSIQAADELVQATYR